MKTILAPHYEATAGRVAAEGGVVPAVRDTAFPNYSAHRATKGLGPIGSTENGPVGIVLHDTMAFAPAGMPRGLVDIQCRARDPDEFGLSEFKKNLPGAATVWRGLISLQSMVEGWRLAMAVARPNGPRTRVQQRICGQWSAEG